MFIGFGDWEGGGLLDGPTKAALIILHIVCTNIKYYHSLLYSISTVLYSIHCCQAITALCIRSMWPVRKLINIFSVEIDIYYVGGVTPTM